jgi:cysteine-rich repeat protein
MRGISAVPLGFAAALILSVAGFATSSGAVERHYLVYLSGTTACEFPAGVTNPATFQSVPGATPVLPPTVFALSQSLTRQLCFFDWNPVPLTTPAAQVCQPNPTTKGDEICEQLLRFTAQGFTIQSFTPASGFQANRTNATLNVIGGSVAGQTRTSLGTITLLGTATGGTFRLVSGDYMEADAVKHLVSNILVAQISGACGNGVIDAPEECDDGNRVSGDACFRTCELQTGVRFTGTPTGVGGITGSLSGVQKTLPTAGLSTASDIADAFANLFNADPTLIGQVIEVDPKDNSIFSDGNFGTFASSDSGITTVPEPTRVSGLVAGALLLAAFARSPRLRGSRSR